ncbi:MAG: magnesium transporter [Chthoniobacteraceae bacterium]
MPEPAHFQRPVLEVARTDFPKLHADMSVAGALEVIREHGVGERIIYFYVVDLDDRLVGVLPTRRLLASAPEAKLNDLMIRRVVALPHTATLLDACDLFVMHKFYALPVLDAERRVVGVIDVNAFTEGLLDLNAAEPTDTLFETLGFHLEQLRGASPWKAFRVRFPWLLATVASGTCAAFMAGFFEQTLSKTLVLSFFLALVLALAESISIQSMTLTLQALRTRQPTWSWFWKNMPRELATSLLIGVTCGLIVFTIAAVWRGQLGAAGVIGGSIAGGMVIAGAAGLLVPSALHAMKLDPKISAGPFTLAIADLAALALYFTLAWWLQLAAPRESAFTPPHAFHRHRSIGPRL